MSMTDEPTPTTDTPETAEAQASAPQVDAPDAPAENSGAKTAAKGAPASFGLVFQAPDLTDVPVRTSRPRRATAGAAAAQSASAGDRDVAAAGRPTQENSERQDAPPESAHASQGDDTDSSGGDDGDSGSKNRRRKRGGKGRRGRGQGGETNPNNDGDDGDDGDERTSSEVGPSDDSSADTTDGGDDKPTANRQGSSGKSGSASKSGTKSSKSSTSGDSSKSGTKGATSNDGAKGNAGSSNASTHGSDEGSDGAGDDDEADGSSKRRRRRRRGDSPERPDRAERPERSARDEVTGVRGSTRLEAKRQRRREGREVGRRRTVISEAEFLARRESVDRVMAVRGLDDRTQIGVLEDGVLVEHYVSQETQATSVGNVYLGRVQNVLPSMEAAFVDIGKGRNAVLYAGEVNWDAAGLEVHQAKRIENALHSGESVLVQVTKDPIGHKGARLTSQVSLPGRFLVYVPGNSMTGISRKLPDTERARLKKILKEVVPAEAGVIVRTAAEGASEAELRADVERLTAMWESIQVKAKSKAKSANGPVLLHGEPDMTVRVIRDVFNEDFSKLIVSGDEAWGEVSDYIDHVAPDLRDRVEKWTGTEDIFTTYRVTEALAKAMDRKVWLPSGGSLVIDRTEAMTVVDVNTGKFVGSGGNLEETVTKNNIEAAEEIVRQLRLRDIGGIIVIDFIDMVLESNRDLVVRRLLECLGRDRTKHQVAEVTSLGLVQMTRKRVGSGLIEIFSTPCVHCNGRGLVVHSEPVEKPSNDGHNSGPRSKNARRGRGAGSSDNSHGAKNGSSSSDASSSPSSGDVRSVAAAKNPSGPTAAQIAAAAHAAALNAGSSDEAANATAEAVTAVHVDGADQASNERAAMEPTSSDSAPAAPTEQTSSEQPAPAVKAPKRSATREARAPATKPASTPAPTVAAVATPVAGPSSAPDPTPAHDASASAPTLAVEADVNPPIRPRRKRGRVVAPAGPPVGTPGEDDTP